MVITPKTYIGVVLDQSGSMSYVRQETIDAFNAFVQSVRETAQNQEVHISLYTFANTVHRVFDNQNVNALQPLDFSSYVPNGSTALFDGLCACINDFKALPDANDENVSFLVRTITDGEENNSLSFNIQRAPQLLLETQKTDRWTYAFQVPPGGYAKHFSEKFGVSMDNIIQWERTKQGVAQTVSLETRSTQKFFTERLAGVKSSNAYYVTTDLSKIDTEQIKKNLVDIRDQFKVYEVPKEMRVDEFVLSKTGKSYIIGSAYYQLMKREKIQPTKAVLLMEKGKKSIWGGKEARQLIGLPDNGEAKVTPGNHSNYDIFVQSRAINRKLPRGTKVLIDIDKTVPDQETWDSQTAIAAAEAKRQAEAAASGMEVGVVAIGQS